MNNNVDVNKLLEMIQKMDKRELEKGIEQASKFINSKDKDEILKKINDRK